MGQAQLKHGDFTGLAANYSKYRPGYSRSVAKALLGLFDAPASELTFADVGAGTGIWTRQMAAFGFTKVYAVEPNDDMRSHGESAAGTVKIEWRKGDGEKTGLADASCDLLTMASSFHWVDYDKGMKEFRRVLKPGGRFAVLWNPRYIEANPLLVEIENYLTELKPDIKRVSSGRSGITERLTEMLSKTDGYEDVVYMEGWEVNRQSHEEYIGAWLSVNDLRFQLGEELFEKFIGKVEKRIASEPYIETVYLTRLWSVRRI